MKFYFISPEDANAHLSVNNDREKEILVYILITKL